MLKPCTVNKMKIEDIFCEVMERESLPDNFEDLKLGAIPEWDSLANMNFLMFIENAFSIRFSFDEMSELISIKLIRDRLSELVP